MRSILLNVPVSDPRASASSCSEHVTACEISEQKRTWNLSNFSARCVYGDIMELGLGSAYCHVHKKKCKVPASDSAFAGTSCKDLSSQKGTCKYQTLSHGDGTSAQTLTGFCGYLKLIQPLLMGGENVGIPALTIASSE